MKIVKVEVEVHLPEHIDDVNVTEGIDHMLDAGGADMVDKVFQCAAHPVIDAAIAENCVELTVNDSEVVSSKMGQPEHDEPPRKLTVLTQLDDYHNPPGLVETVEGGDAVENPAGEPNAPCNSMQIHSVRVSSSGYVDDPEV